MKCDRCFFCTEIGAGIYAEYPMKYCKRTGKYKIPFIMIYEKNGIFKKRRLDLGDIKDCKIWHDVGCDVNPSTVRKAKIDFIKKLKEECKEVTE